MKQLTVISGKGGTGKTTIMAALAALAKQAVLVDADVDAADLHLLLQPQIQRRENFMAGKKAVIDIQKCDGCQKCVQACRFGAISNLQVDPIACEGCGVCYFICPRAAITLPEVQSGEWFISQTRFGPMIHAQLGVAQENSGKLVTLVRKEAIKIAQEKNYALVLIDGPPGIGCPVIASLGGVDAALVVTEPSLSGIHDMQRILNLCGHFNIPAWVCINKADINLANTRKIKKFCQEQGTSVISEIPFDPVVTKAMIKGQTVIEYAANSVSLEIEKIWKYIGQVWNYQAERISAMV
ncbi:MAG: 4Fe-4S binding protein [Thermodesulfobacteriota bacterium]